MNKKTILWSLALVLLASCGDKDDTSHDEDDAAEGSGDDGSTGADDTGEAVDADPTWTNFAEGFFAEYCVSCHSPEGQASADFGDYDIVSRPKRLNSIRCGVAPELLDGCEGEHPPGWFPIGDGPMPTDDERWTLVDWCDADGPY